jgi:two-component system NtrC family sensor kinase
MSLRTALLTIVILFGIVATVFVGLISVLSLGKNVSREAQERVNHDLNVVQSRFEEQLARLAGSIGEDADGFSIYKEDVDLFLEEIKQRYRLHVLNICDSDGKAVAGTYPDKESSIPIGMDPVLRRALGGSLTWGTMLLDSDRLQLEGGAALKNASVVAKAEAASEPATTSALFWWLAYPIKDAEGRVVGLLYGGRNLNYNFDLVDSLRKTIFGDEQYGGKPIGTVTIFLQGVRVATNVLGPDRKRAVGTFVSEEVQERVLDQGEPWLDRAWVVDEWYISGYRPLIDPDGSTIGMLYVGLLEAPYRAMKTELIRNILGPVLLVFIVAAVISLLLVRRITAPLKKLSEAASNLGQGQWDNVVDVSTSFHEIDELSQTFREMQTEIVDRDRELREKNRVLQETNRNYMEMLGFVTHELKSPLAAMQTMVSVLVDGIAGEMTAKAREFLIRIKRSSEELQDMVKNYLDLSRVERGELKANKSDIDFISEVIDPTVDQVSQLFDSKDMSLDLDLPKQLSVKADPELLRIATTNYLSNAAKYGRDGGKARLKAELRNDQAVLTVWNEGEGFTSEEGEQLFNKFSRLKNPNTRDKRGSGLGLYLCKQILDLHNGEVQAESEPGKWASFSFTFPASLK